MVDKLTKYSYVILFKEKYIIGLLKIILIHEWIWYDKIPKETISNRNSL